MLNRTKTFKRIIKKKYNLLIGCIKLNQRIESSKVTFLQKDEKSHDNL